MDEVMPAGSSSGSITDALQSIFNSTVQATGQRIQREIVGDQFDGSKTDPSLGVDEYGRPFAAGKASFLGSSIAGVPAPLVLVGVGILALAIVLHKS